MSVSSPAAFLRGPDGWQRAHFTFQNSRQGNTRLTKQFFQYPFHITRPVHLDSEWPELATLIMQSTSGGLYRDDRLSLSLKFNKNSCAHVTTQSSTKVHSMEEYGNAKFNISVLVDSGAHAELINDAMILFPESRLDTDLDILVDKDSSAIITDSALWHEPDKNLTYQGFSEPRFNSFKQTISIRKTDDLAPSVRECQWSGKESVVGVSTWSKYKVQGSIYAVAPSRDIEKIKDYCLQALDETSHIVGGISLLPNNLGVIGRFLGCDGDAMRLALKYQWRAARYAITGKRDGLKWTK